MTSEINWLALCRRVVARQRELFAGTTASIDRTVYEGRGEGGDMTLELDRRCEDVVFEELDALVAEGHSMLAVSEERGIVTLGEGEPECRVVIDPIDGSMNVRRTIPSHSLSIAVATGAGETMGDVSFGFVHDFGADEEFAAERGGGTTLDGETVNLKRPHHGLEVVGIESADPEWISPAVESLRGNAYRLRVIGSIAITLSYVAVRRFDAMFSARGCRSVDAAAAQLIVKESGGEMEFVGFEDGAAPLDLETRYAVVAALDPEHMGVVRDAQAACRVSRS